MFGHSTEGFHSSSHSNLFTNREQLRSQPTLTRLADPPGPNFQMLTQKETVFLLQESINHVSYCLLVSFYHWFATQYREIRIADVARPRSALNHHGVISVTNNKSENRHKFTRNVHGFNLRGRSSLPHNPRHLSEYCCWSGANWKMPVPVFVFNLSHDFWLICEDLSRELSFSLALSHTHAHTHLRCFQFPSTALWSSRCQPSVQAGGLKPPSTPSVTPGSLFRRTVVWACNTRALCSIWSPAAVNTEAHHQGSNSYQWFISFHALWPLHTQNLGFDKPRCLFLMQKYV